METNQTPKLTVEYGGVPVITHDDLRRWQRRMGFTLDEAAIEFGVDRSTYAAWLTGVSRATGKPIDLPRTVALSAMAIELGLNKVLPAPAYKPRKPRGRPRAIYVPQVITPIPMPENEPQSV